MKKVLTLHLIFIFTDQVDLWKFIVFVLVLVIITLVHILYAVFSTFNIPIYTSPNESTSINNDPGHTLSYAYKQLRYTDYIDGSLKVVVSEEEQKASDQLAIQRRLEVRAAMQHNWHGYQKYAMGKDELKPLRHVLFRFLLFTLRKIV